VPELVGDEMRALPGTERFGNEVYPVLLPYDGQQILVGTRADGLFLFDGASVRPFPTEIDPLVKSSALYRGSVMPDGTYALATTAGGVALMDRQGHQLHVVNESSGLPSDQAYYPTSDRDGVLWVGTGRVIARVEV